MKKNKILFISVHPDDETLGCGGTILKSKKQGEEIYWLIITSMGNNHPLINNQEAISKRADEVKLVANKYGFIETIELGFHEILLDEINFRELVESIGKVIDKIKPEIIYINNRSDVHSDHRVGFNAVSSCTKSFRKPFIKRILMYETLSETEFAPALNENTFNPNVFVDISSFIEEKISIMSIYNSEIMDDNYARSLSAIRALATYRGSRIGVKCAESFMLLFEQS
jgi:N-acetylglucosamine malate deacetylase 1